MLSVNFLTPARPPLGRRVTTTQLLVGLSALAVLIGFAAWSWALFGHVAQLRSELSSATLAAAGIRQSRPPQVVASRIIEASRTVIPRDVWLTDVAVAADRVTFEGYARSYPLIAGFMAGLQNTGALRTVVLAMSQRETHAGDEVVRFRIAAGLPGAHAAADVPNGTSP